MPIAKIETLWYLTCAESFRHRRKTVKIETDVSDKIQVIVKEATRDPKTKKITYTTYDSFNVVDADAEEVFEAVHKACESKKAASS